MISFDGDLDCLREALRKVGKIRKFITGETKFKSKQAFYAIVIFKFEFDLVKCFRDGNLYLQGIIDSASKGMHF